jgi:hypothetical protein
LLLPSTDRVYTPINSEVLMMVGTCIMRLQHASIFSMLEIAIKCIYLQQFVWKHTCFNVKQEHADEHADLKVLTTKYVICPIYCEISCDKSCMF